MGCVEGCVRCAEGCFAFSVGVCWWLCGVFAGAFLGFCWVICWSCEGVLLFAMMGNGLLFFALFV